MRRTYVAAGIAVALALTAVPVAAASAPAAVVQETPGSVRLPTRFPVNDPEDGYPGAGRRLWLANTALNGVAGFVLPIDPATWGGAFEIKGVTDATGSANMDVYLYSDLGALDPTSGAGNATSTAEYQSRAVGGEKGFVPFGSTKALVFMPSGANAAFTYEATGMPTVSLEDGPLDVTIPAGGYVGWRNDTGDYAFVRHVPSDDQEVLFDSSPEPATGIRAGEVFSARFGEVGTYSYESSAGTGTITVVPGPGLGTPAG